MSESAKCKAAVQGDGSPGGRVIVACAGALLVACAEPATSSDVQPAVLPQQDIVRLPWARTLQHAADAQVVTSAEWRARLAATGLPWLVLHEQTGIELILIVPGQFRRGAPEGDRLARPEERPAHAARVTKPFYIGRYEVTQEQWLRVMDENPSDFQGEPELPLENATVPAVYEFLAATGFDLPTEIQWEWACRGDDDAVRYGALPEVAWYARNSGQRTHPVGLKRPNAFGTYDMLGNVWELCRGDWNTGFYAECAEREPVDEVFERASWRGSYYQSFRGGSWLGDEEDLRATRRQRFSPGYGFHMTGFRVARRAS